MQDILWRKLFFLLLFFVSILLMGKNRDSLLEKYFLQSSQCFANVQAGSEEMGMKIAITFDDGPNIEYTEKLLEGLEERNVSATFFLIGKNAEENEALVRKIYEEGHMIGNHTYSHLRLEADNYETYKDELLRTNEIIQRITGETPMFCRPPFGAWDSEIEGDIGMIPVLWTVDPRDWDTQNTEEIVQYVVTHAKENGIILLHDEYASSVDAALAIIDELQAKGFVFVTVDEIVLGESSR